MPEGLTLLAGKPKLGKSWLALSVALSIAAGGVALGAQPVTQGDVLYLALEDNARRLQAHARQLLTSMTGIPGGMDFALDWPRLGEGGLSALEDYLKAHPNVRLVVIDTWARVAPPSGERRCSQYAGDYEALTPLKHLADTYHVSILAVHHLRKTSSSDVLDEIIGSTGMTGAIDGALILKRERGQTEATLFVTGRDVEREQHLALSFDATTALWTLVGDAEEVGRTRARQQILDLLREQQPDGMSPREIAEALAKNYHTTRSILRKMEETGEVRQSAGRYVALSRDTGQDQNQGRASGGSRQQPDIIDQGEHVDQQQRQCIGGVDGIDDSDYTDYSDDTDYVDYIDYADDASSNGTNGHQRALTQELSWPVTLHGGVTGMQQESEHEENTVISVINRNQHHQSAAPIPTTEVQGENVPGAKNTTQVEQSASLHRDRNRCPHHPRESLVRFDPADQAWCDRMDCWDCYRLMKIGEALSYRCVIDRVGNRLIHQGIEAWIAFVLSQGVYG